MSNNQFNQTDANLKSNLKEGGPSEMRDKLASNLMGRSPIEELQLQVDAKNKEDIEQLSMLLTQIFSYPSQDFAEVHRDANRLGQYDIRKQNEDIKTIKTQEQNQMNEKTEYCSCCGFIKQESPVKVCSRFQIINNVGISTYLYFQTLKNLSILLVVAFIIYGIYSIITNILSSLPANSRLSSITGYTPQDFLILSIAPKQKFATATDKTFLVIQCWIGMALLIIWTVALIFMKYYEKKEQVRVEEQTISASDFSIVVQYMPTELTQEEVQQQLDAYYQTIQNVPQNLKKPFKIKKYNVGKPFYLSQADLTDDETKEITKQTKAMHEMFASWIFQRQESATFSTTKEYREEQYKKYEQLIKKKQKKAQQIIQKVKEEFKKENQKETTTVFITFETNRARSLITSQNSIQISDQIRFYLTCCQSQNRFKPVTKDGVSHRIRIARAPEPQDIIWTNLGVSDFTIYTRKLITYVVTLILLGASFAAVYGLSVAQYDSQQKAAANADAGTDYISIIISVVISLINIVLGQVIRRLTSFERDYTETFHQTSLAIKIVAAQLINSIVVPIMANWFIKGNNLYDDNGLADEIFLLGITNSFITPGIRLVQPEYYISRVLAWWFSRSTNRIWLTQLEFNQKYQLIAFEIGFQYIYIVNLFLFTCFYMSLQPIIILFSLFGYLLNYWAQKYTLFNRMKRPVPGTDLINVAMWQLILLGGVMYALGSLCWTNFFPGAIPSDALIPNIIAVVIGVILFLFPFTAINRCMFSDEDNAKQLVYDEHRIYLPSEYDRLNPTTTEKGLQDYLDYIEQFKKKMSSASQEQKNKIAKMFVAQGRRGSQRVPQMGPGIGAGMGFGNNNFFMSPQQQGINPMMLGSQIMPNNAFIPHPSVMPQVPLNMGTMQNSNMRMPMQPQYNMMQPQMQPQFNMMQPQMHMMQPQVIMQPPRFAFQQQVPQPFGFGQPQQMMGFGGVMGGMGMGGFGYR